MIATGSLGAGAASGVPEIAGAVSSVMTVRVDYRVADRAESSSGTRSNPTSFHSLRSRRKYARAGLRHGGYCELSAEMSTATKPPTAIGKPLGASMVVVVLLVADSDRMFLVALSNSNQDARYVGGASATLALTA